MTQTHSTNRSAEDASSLANAGQKSDGGHLRINDSLLGKVEKQALLWLAARMPAWVTPDTLTLLGLLAAILIFLGYALTRFSPAYLWLASLGFVLHWFGDSLDGTLARYRKIERPRYGFFVDHILDTVSVVLIFMGLAVSPYLRFDLAMLALTAYLMLAIDAYLATSVNGVFRISYGRLGPTEGRLLAMLANTVVYFTGNQALLRLQINNTQVPLSLYDGVGLFFMAAVTVMFLYSTITTSLVLSREDRLAAKARRCQERAAKAARRKAAHKLILVTGRPPSPSRRSGDD